MVTGGASGVSEETCRVLAAARAKVIIVDIDGDGTEKPASQLPAASIRNFDITAVAAVRAGVDGVDKLDTFINEAGIGLVGVKKIS